MLFKNNSHHELWRNTRQREHKLVDYILIGTMELQYKEQLCYIERDPPPQSGLMMTTRNKRKRINITKNSGTYIPALNQKDKHLYE